MNSYADSVDDTTINAAPAIALRLDKSYIIALGILVNMYPVGKKN